MSSISELIQQAENIVIVQADNPDGDSLGSALTLESVLSDLGKHPQLYCAVNMPEYLRYLSGWSRVSSDLPTNFDLSIIVDASAKSLFEKGGNVLLDNLAKKPLLVLDHHAQTASDIEGATLVMNDTSVSSTAELVYKISVENDWQIPTDAFDPLMSGILGDTQGLSNQLASPNTYRVVAELIERGADRPALEEKRRAYSKMPVEIFKYKADLIKRTEFAADGRAAYVIIPNTEITKFSPLYNPGPLIQNDMLQTTGVLVGLVFKVYDDGHLTAMIRCNNTAEIADKLAAEFGGGGHAYAAGFKVQGVEEPQEVINKTLLRAGELLDAVEKT